MINHRISTTAALATFGLAALGAVLAGPAGADTGTAGPTSTSETSSAPTGTQGAAPSSSNSAAGPSSNSTNGAPTYKVGSDPTAGVSSSESANSFPSSPTASENEQDQAELDELMKTWDQKDVLHNTVSILLFNYQHAGANATRLADEIRAQQKAANAEREASELQLKAIDDARSIAGG
ncbi:hypothetical protein [Mycolicibacterium hodleri]|uniref:Uncharacterized protein n=1 Tax=Mycolicibacterium hodleri TaxID=49897 RepID=A0A502EHC9_9MYCO|nr:hypothetical protein [Mycolicibacterium hodleri]TPG37095.1 hypothetical protein EAH80_04345 [Mycolicibacterium hodleri]